MYEFDLDKIPSMLDELESERALWEERAYAAHRTAQICETHCQDVTQRQQALALVISRLMQAVDVYEG